MRSLIFAFLFLMNGVAFAQVSTEVDSEVEALGEAVSERTEKLAAIEAQLAEEPPQRVLLRLRDEVREMRRRGDSAIEALSTEQASLDAAFAELGEPPAEGEPEEPEVLRQQRENLSARRGTITSILSQAQVNRSIASELIEDIALRRREAFTGRLFSRGPLLLAPEPWRLALEGLSQTFATVRGNFTTWAEDTLPPDRRQRVLISLLAALAVALAVFFTIRRFLTRFIDKKIEGVEALQSRRIILAGARTISRMAFGLLAFFFVAEAVRFQDILPAASAPFIQAVWIGLLTLIFADGVSHTFFATRDRAWQVRPLKPSQVIVVRTLIMTAAFALVIELWLRRAGMWIGEVPSLIYIQKGVVAVLLSVLLLLLARRSLWEVDEPRDDADPASPPADKADDAAASAADGEILWARLRVLARIAALGAIIAVIAGFAEFGHFIATRCFALLAVLCAFALVRAILREAVRLIDERFSSDAAHDEEGEARLLYYWTGVAVDALTVLLFVPPVLILFGAAWADVRSWVADAFFGFRIGQINISIAKILTAAVITGAIVWATRSVQKTAEKELFPRSRLDPGVQNSLKTLIGYVGLVIAIAFGISTLGFDLSNLAIIAGALSVGIGFGLQSIVGNFVSGLILLFERPVKVGDWIVTTAGEGIVKKISVRSTEIETFDRSSIIVPNADLISSPVTNWTHKNKLGRVVVPVGAAYKSDAEHVLKVLEDVAKGSPDLLSYPAPFVVFENFGASSLDFSLRGYIRDVGNSLGVRTRLRVAIHKRFLEEGIEIPFPQQDVYVREMAVAAAKAAEEPHSQLPVDTDEKDGAASETVTQAPRAEAIPPVSKDDDETS